jgi:hypothetical protein
MPNTYLKIAEYLKTVGHSIPLLSTVQYPSTKYASETSFAQTHTHTQIL